MRKGAPWLKTMLVPCAWAAKRAKDSDYRAQFFRRQAKRGPQKAICAVAASILTAIHHMLENGVFHQDLGASYVDNRPREAKLKRLVRQLKNLGYAATLHPIADAPKTESATPMKSNMSAVVSFSREPKQSTGT